MTVPGGRNIRTRAVAVRQQDLEHDFRRVYTELDAVAAQFAPLLKTPTSTSGNGSKPYNPIPTGGGSGGTVNANITLSSPSNLLYTNGGTAPITGNSFALTLVPQAANTVFAGPASGADAVPTWRALVSDDLPGGGGAWVYTIGIPATDAGYTALDTDGAVWSNPDTVGTSILLCDSTTVQYPSWRVSVSNIGTGIGVVTVDVSAMGDTLYNGNVAGPVLIPNGAAVDFLTDQAGNWRVV